MLIPGAGNRMAREFAEYRPWKTWAQFDKEIGKYVGQPETDRLKQYVFIPVNLNTGDRRGHPQHSRRRPAHGPRVQGVPAVEDEGAVREGNRQVRGPKGSGAAVALRGDPVGVPSDAPVGNLRTGDSRLLS